MKTAVGFKPTAVNTGIYRLVELKGRKEFFNQKRAKMRERADVRVKPDISSYYFNAETNLFIIGIFD